MKKTLRIVEVSAGCLLMSLSLAYVAKRFQTSGNQSPAVSMTVNPDSQLVRKFSNPTHHDVVYVDDNNYQTQVVDSDEPVIILFVDGWSGLSNREQDNFYQMAFKFHTFAKFAIVNVSNSPKLAKVFNCYAAPAIFFVNQSKQVTGASGYIHKNQLTADIEAFLFGRENLVINVNSLPGVPVSKVAVNKRKY